MRFFISSSVAGHLPRRKEFPVLYSIPTMKLASVASATAIDYQFGLEQQQQHLHTAVPYRRQRRIHSLLFSAHHLNLPSRRPISASRHTKPKSRIFFVTARHLISNSLISVVTVRTQTLNSSISSYWFPYLFC